MNRFMDEMSAIQPREFQPAIEFTKPGELDFLKDAYEVGKDGKVSWTIFRLINSHFSSISRPILTRKTSRLVT